MRPGFALTNSTLRDLPSSRLDSCVWQPGPGLRPPDCLCERDLGLFKAIGRSLLLVSGFPATVQALQLKKEQRATRGRRQPTEENKSEEVAVADSPNDCSRSGWPVASGESKREERDQGLLALKRTTSRSSGVVASHRLRSPFSSLHLAMFCPMRAKMREGMPAAVVCGNKTSGLPDESAAPANVKHREAHLRAPLRRQMQGTMKHPLAREWWLQVDLLKQLIGSSTRGIVLRASVHTDLEGQRKCRPERQVAKSCPSPVLAPTF